MGKRVINTILVGNPRTGEHLGDPGIYGRVISIYIRGLKHAARQFILYGPRTDLVLILNVAHISAE
jgi:hypothetical protein